MLSFVHDLQVCASPNSKDDVFYLRVLFQASYRKSVKYMYKVKMAVQGNVKPKILAAECDNISQACTT